MMRPRTAVAITLLVIVFAGVGVYAIAQGFAGGGTLTEHWITDTARDTTANHHVPAAGRVDGDVRIVLPVNANGGSGCALVAVDAESTPQWRDGMPAADCNIHGYGDPIFADFDRDGRQEVYVGTTESALVGLNASTGNEVFRHDLSWWGYAAPIVTDFTPAPGRELTVVDLSGGITVLTPNNTVVWTANVSSVIAPPAIDDFDADGEAELGVGEGKNVTLLTHAGDIERRTPVGSTVNWMATVQADDDAAIELVVGTIDGRVVAVDGRRGAIEWTRQFGSSAAVRAVGDGDTDGEVEVYATAADGKLRAITARNGTTEWTTTLTTADVQMTPPPVLGDLDGSGDPELVAPAQDGVLSVIDPTTGEVLASYQRDVPMWTFPALADIDRDGTPEILAIYGDGRVVALSYDTGDRG